VRAIFTKAGGSLAGSGAVAWQFEQLGLISVPREGVDADEVALAAIDAGASDVDTESDPIEVSTEASELEAVRKGLEAAGIRIESAELTMQAKSTVEVEGNQVRQNLRLVDLLEDHDDVQRVTANFDIPDDVLAEAMA
jgi:transcriptional/translational regulatory protein YebC/TACO1